MRVVYESQSGWRRSSRIGLFLLAGSTPMGLVAGLGLLPHLANLIMGLGIALVIGWFFGNLRLYKAAYASAGEPPSLLHGLLWAYRAVMFYTVPLQFVFFIVLIMGAIDGTSGAFGMELDRARDAFDLASRLVMTAFFWSTLFGGLYAWYRMPGMVRRKGMKIFMGFLGLPLCAAIVAGPFWLAIYADQNIPRDAFVYFLLGLMAFASFMFMLCMVGAGPMSSGNPWGFPDGTAKSRTPAEKPPDWKGKTDRM